MADDLVTVALSGDEALVLFDLLHRWEDEDRVAPPRDAAEQVALWNLSALLERALVEPLRSDYAELLSAAKARLGDSG